jgi:hypothetical protein
MTSSLVSRSGRWLRWEDISRRPTPDCSPWQGPYRSWATAHPRLYEVATRRPLARDRIGEGVESAAAARIVAAVDGDEHRARALWALAHGLVDLELANRFPPGADLDATWRTALMAFEQR